MQVLSFHQRFRPDPPEEILGLVYSVSATTRRPQDFFFFFLMDPPPPDISPLPQPAPLPISKSLSRNPRRVPGGGGGGLGRRFGAPISRRDGALRLRPLTLDGLPRRERDARCRGSASGDA